MDCFPHGQLWETLYVIFLDAVAHGDACLEVSSLLNPAAAAFLFLWKLISLPKELLLVLLSHTKQNGLISFIFPTDDIFNLRTMLGLSFFSPDCVRHCGAIFLKAAWVLVERKTFTASSSKPIRQKGKLCKDFNYRVIHWIQMKAS